MTEKEKQIFEKWFEEKKEKCEVYGNGDDFYVDDEIKKFCLMGYELGLKAGSQQWHDLRKDPNDLPKNNRYVWCDYNEGYGKGYYHKVDGGWWIEGHMFCSAIDAWCELPLFIDKE